MRSKNTLEGTNSRITEAEDRISEVEDRMVEINEAEWKKEKRIKRNEDNLRDLWDNVKCPNIRIIGVPKEDDKKKGNEKILEKTMVQNFSKTSLNIREFTVHTPRHTLIKLTKIKHKEQILKAARGKQQHTRGFP